MARVLRPQPTMSPPAEEYAATALELSLQVQESARVELDVAYGPSEDQDLDVYLPDVQPSQPMPVLLFIHGGGWTNGYKDWMGFMAPAITKQPAIFISVAYRLAWGRLAA